MILAKFTEQVKKNRDKIAIKVGDKFFTYKELERYACKIAHRIIEKIPFHGKTQHVGLLFDDAFDMTAAILGVLKQGHTYIPLSSDYPLERLSYMVTHSEISFILTDNLNKQTAEKLQPTNHMILLEGEEIKKTDLEINPGDIEIKKNADIMYILYTSGSTGKPKGVMQKEGSVFHFISQYTDKLSITSDDRMTLFSSFSHDASIMDLFGALLNGATLYPMNILKLTDLTLLSKWLIKEKITIWHSVPTLYRYFARALKVDEFYSDLRYIVLGGEPVIKYDINIFTKLFPDAIFYNLYGQTESSYNSGMPVTRGNEIKRITLGETVEGVELLVVDEEGNEVNPLETGEIIVASPYISPGYWKAEEATKACFQESPELGKIYRTGDCGCLLPDGCIEFLGRKDSQVKIRGYRVELGEIESLLLAHDQIKDAAVITINGPNAIENHCQEMEKFLAAYIVSAKTFAQEDLREYLGTMLPNYMIPSYIVQIDSLPLTISGKVDRKALPAPGLSEADEMYITPIDDMETKLAEIWADVLKISKDGIGRNSNFFELGGHSLKATILAYRIHKELDSKISLADIFKSSTIRKLADHIKRQEREKYIPIEPIEKRHFYETSFNQKRLWIIEQMNPRDNSFNMGGIIKMNGMVDEGLIKKTVEILINNHESLRTGFKQVEDSVVQFVADDYYIPFEIVDLSSREEEKKDIQCEKIINEFQLKPFNLDSPPLFKSLLIKKTEQQYLFAYSIHHVVSDAWSMNILERDFRHFYQNGGLNIKNESTTIKYKDFAYWHNRLLKNEKKNIASREFWINFLTEELPPLRLPQDFQYDGIDKLGGLFRFVIPEQYKDALQETGKKHCLTLFTLLFSIYNIFLSVFSGQKIVVSSIVNFGREHQALHDLVGFFVNSIIFKNEIDFDMTFTDFANEIQMSVLKFFQHQNYPLELVLDEVGRKYPLVPVSFNMINSNLVIDSLDLENMDSFHIVEKWNAKFDLEFYILEYRNGIEIKASYNKRLFKETNIEFLMARYQKMVEFFALNPSMQLKECIKEKKGKVFRKKL